MPVQFNCITGVNPLELQRRNWWEEINSTRADVGARKCLGNNRMHCLGNSNVN